MNIISFEIPVVVHVMAIYALFLAGFFLVFLWDIKVYFNRHMVSFTLLNIVFGGYPNDEQS